MDDVEEAHDGGAVVGDGGAALVVVDELVHAAWPQRGAHRVRHRRARVDVAHHLRAPLRRVRPLLEQDDLRLLQNPPQKPHPQITRVSGSKTRGEKSKGRVNGDWDSCAYHHGRHGEELAVSGGFGGGEMEI